MTHKSMFDNFFSSQRPVFSMSDHAWNPPTDIYEDGATTVIRMEVAGLDEDQFEIVAERNLLVVRGRRVLNHDERVNYHLMEIHYGRFERAFAFSFNLRQEQIRANYEKGFLVIRIGKAAEPVTRVSIDITP